MNPPAHRLNERLEPLIKGLAFEGHGGPLAAWERALFEMATRLSLSANQYAIIEKHYEALQSTFSAAENPQLRKAHIFLQGSIRARTAILPHPDATGDEAEVDADAVLWLPNASVDAMQTYDAVAQRIKDGARTQIPPTLKNRCIRLHYRDTSPGFHMDVTPARNHAGNSHEKGEGHLDVPDCASRCWKDSAPVAFAEWFDGVCDANLPFELHEVAAQDKLLLKSSIEPAPDHDSYIDFNPLRAAIKLMKAHRDSYFLPTPIKKLNPISIIITTLAARAYEQIATEKIGPPRRAGAVLIEIIDRMPQFVGGVNGNRVVSNPVIPSENFAEKWNGVNGRELERAFWDWHSELTSAVRLGLWKFPTRGKLEEALTKAFSQKVIQERVLTDVHLAKTALSGSAQTEPAARAPEERFIEELFDVCLQYELKLDCKVVSRSDQWKLLRGMKLGNRWLPFGRKLEFFVSRCTVPMPFQLYWKVRNVGPIAAQRRQLRGQIEPDAGRQTKIERTDFGGEHFVEAYAVKYGVCVARDRIIVPIGSK